MMYLVLILLILGLMTKIYELKEESNRLRLENLNYRDYFTRKFKTKKVK